MPLEKTFVFNFLKKQTKQFLFLEQTNYRVLLADNLNAPAGPCPAKTARSPACEPNGFLRYPKTISPFAGHL